MGIYKPIGKTKMKKNQERDNKGRFIKGHKSLSPGRPKGEPRDNICKNGKRRSVEGLINDLLAAYQTLGGEKFLKKWAAQSNRNLTKFIDILFKFAPHPEGYYGDVNIEVISAVPRPDPGDAAKRIREMQAELKEKDEELKRLKALNNVRKKMDKKG